MHRLLVALLLTQGCAFGIEGPDPNRPRSQMPKCDTGKGAVALDGTMAALAAVVALSLVGNDESAAALVPLGIGSIYAAGAISGNSAANRCRAAMSDFESYLAARDTLPAEEPRSLPAESRVRPLPRSRATPEPDAAPQPAPEPAPAVAATPPGPPRAAPGPASAAAPAPAAAPARAAAPPKPAAPAASDRPDPATDAGGDDEWSAFWREVP